MRSQCISRLRSTCSLPTTGMLFSAWQATMQARAAGAAGEVDRHAPLVLLVLVVDRRAGCVGAGPAAACSSFSRLSSPSASEASAIGAALHREVLLGDARTRACARRAAPPRGRARTRAPRRAQRVRRRTPTPRADRLGAGAAVAERQRHHVVGVAGHDRSAAASTAPAAQAQLDASRRARRPSSFAVAGRDVAPRCPR